MNNPPVRPVTNDHLDPVRADEIGFEADLSAKGARPNACLYVSTPITTGPLLLARSDSDVEALARHNIAHARQVAARLGEKSKRLIIDPTTLDDVVGWEQADYHEFWVKIIRRWVGEIAFCDGWEFSTGCSIEFSTALEFGIPRFDERFEVLSDTRALELLDKAVSALTAGGRSAAFQRDACRSLRLRNARNGIE